VIRLEDGFILYHASYMEVVNIDLSKCSPGLDFGKGFYLTSSFNQAYSYVAGAVKKAIRLRRVPTDFSLKNGVINVYQYHNNLSFDVHYFDEANIEWLHFIAANRNDELFPGLLEQFATTDVVAGKVANDNTARTLNAYMDGIFGIPGDQQADDMAIQTLLPNRLQDQFCFRTKEAINALEFVRSERYGDIHPSD